MNLILNVVLYEAFKFSDMIKPRVMCEILSK